MSIQQLRYVVAAVKNKSNVQAANSVIVSPQAISKAISATERRFGKQLFDRTDGQRTPTEFALSFASKAESIVNEYDDLTAMADTLSETTSVQGDITIALAATPFRGETFDAKLLDQFVEQNPLVRLSLTQLSSESCIHATSMQIVDGAIVPGRIMHTDLDCIRIGRQSMSVIAHHMHPLGDKKRLSLSELACFKIAFPSNLYTIYPIVERCFKQANLPLPSFSHIPPDASSAIEFLKEGGLIMSGPNNPLLLLDVDLKEIRLDTQSAIIIPICLINSKNNDKAALKGLKTFLYQKAPRLR
ncbi:MAG: LysR family transcriptional regulator [Adlercreutzia sp.]|uniref:LysR family transcriptional regulator n=1 Tax=uncultured Adlercreutzia sp. TaxID=875803 RepID=UPI0021739FB5|nr:LysR family transcriptional regulator [uncultured Adlercreutzia sp.]MCI8424246.1 LysR family transcriptional regulator [Adlercreutzia sp.]